MSAARLLEQLRAAGAQLRVVGGRLEAKRVPPPLAPLARAHAAELRALLAPPAPAELPPEALGLDPDDPIALAAGADPEPPGPPAAGWALLPPSTVPFHERPEVQADPARCLGCGARAMHLAQCRRCGCLAPIAGPTLEPPAGLPAFDDQIDAAPLDLPVEPCPGCGAPTTATSGLGACECGWARMPAPLAAPPPVATMEAPSAPSSAPSAPSTPAPAPRRRTPRPAPAPPVLSIAGQAALDRVLAMVSAEIPGVMLLEIRPIRRRAPAVEAPVETFEQVEAPQLEQLERPSPPSARRLPPFRWQDVLSAMPPEGPRAPSPPVAPPPTPLDTSPHGSLTRAPPALPAAPCPVEPPAVRAARFGFVILPSGQYVEAHRAHERHLPPFQPRFAGRPDPGEAARQELRQRALEHCTSTLGHRPGQTTVESTIAAPPPPLPPVGGHYPAPGHPCPAPPPPGWGWSGYASCARCGVQGVYLGPRGHHCHRCEGRPASAA